MASSVYSPGHRSPGLPVYSTTSSAVREKFSYHNLSPWLISIPLPLPCIRKPLRLFFLNPRRLHQFTILRFGRAKGSVILTLAFLSFLFFIFALAKRFGTREKKWPRPFLGDPPTLVYKREDLQRIWQWEIASGHYPSRRPSKHQLLSDT